MANKIETMDRFTTIKGQKLFNQRLNFRIEKRLKLWAQGALAVLQSRRR